MTDARFQAVAWYERYEVARAERDSLRSQYEELAGRVGAALAVPDNEYSIKENGITYVTPRDPRTVLRETLAALSTNEAGDG